uniref:Protein phosphatase 1 regulatory subunit 7 n=1 Tax=Setaria digitata TaxID=48799 RepID=A0A915PX50_9BILA
MPLMGGMYGKRSFIPFPGGIYIKRRIGGYYNKRSFLPEGIQNKGPNFAEFNPPSAHYVGIGKVGPFPYEKWQQHQLEEDNNDFYKDDSNSLQTLPNTLRHIKNFFCIPPSIPAKDSKGTDCCKLPPEIFPHNTVYEEFCTAVYFGVMADGPDGRFCRLSPLTQFQFTINSPQNSIDIADKTTGDPCRKERNTASLVRVPNQSINMFLYVKVLKGQQNLGCHSTDENTYYYYIGLQRKDFDWRWHPYDEKAYTHLEEQGQRLLAYLNEPHENHTWSDGTKIFAKDWDNPRRISSNVVISNYLQLLAHFHTIRMCADILSEVVPEAGRGDQGEEENAECVELDVDTKELDLTRHRIKKIEGFDFLRSIEYLCLRWNLIKKIENLHMLTTLTELDLYDNQITKIENLDELINLESLDLSFNRITLLENLSSLKKLKNAYFVHNKIKKIEGLEELTELEYLELGDNRIKKIENLSKNSKIKRLFLGANQIHAIENLDHLKQIEVLSLPANAIEEIKGLDKLTTLRELYLSQNGIEYITGLENNLNLEILDLNYNRLRSVSNIKHLHKLTDFWAKKNQLERVTEVNELAHLPSLKLVYLEMNPFSECSAYRGKVIRMLPQIEKLDASYCRETKDQKH